MRPILTVLIPALLIAGPVFCESPLKPPNNGGVYVIAHRGAHQGIPENTLPAYAKAIELGCDFVEIDVRTTKDGQLVSVHNDSIDAYVEGDSGNVRDMTLAELKALDVGARIGSKWEGTRIPTVVEILDLCQGKIGIYVDLKDGNVEQLAALIQERGMDRDCVWFAGSRQLETLVEVCPDCIPMPDPGPEKGLPRIIERHQPKVIAAVWRNYSSTFPKTCHEAGALCFVDEDTPDCWDDALAWGSDGIQTDHPAELIAYLKAREVEKKD